MFVVSRNILGPVRVNWSVSLAVMLSVSRSCLVSFDPSVKPNRASFLSAILNSAQRLKVIWIYRSYDNAGNIPMSNVIAALGIQAL